MVSDAVLREGPARGARARAAALAALACGAITLPACGGGGGNDKIPILIGQGVSASTEGGEETLFGITPADDRPLLASLSPESSTLVLEVIDEASGDVIATGAPQGTVRVASWVPAAGVPVCVRVENTAETAYAGVLTVEEAPTATIVNLNTPGGGDGLIVRLTNDIGTNVVSCLERLTTNPGTGTWTFVFGLEDLAQGPFTANFQLININDPAMMMPSEVIAGGVITNLPVTAGVVTTAAVNLTVQAGNPPPTPDCPEPGILSPLVPAGSYGTSDLR